jgi:hypothetical protein
LTVLLRTVLTQLLIQRSFQPLQFAQCTLQGFGFIAEHGGGGFLKFLAKLIDTLTSPFFDLPGLGIESTAK